MCFGAMTLGHVIVGVDEATLCSLREHEQVHVRQYEQWGLLFLPAYALSSLWQIAHGRGAHERSFFEGKASASFRPTRKQQSLLPPSPVG